MKAFIRWIIFLSVLIILPVTFALTQDEQPVAIAHKVLDSIQIDAILDEWDRSDPIYLNEKSQVIRDVQAWEGPQDLSCSIYLMWDNKNLYLAVEATEDTPYGAIEMLPMDGQDNFKLYLSTNPTLDPQRTEYATNDFLVYLIIDNLYWDTAFDRSMVPKEARRRFVSKGMNGGQNILDGYSVASIEVENGFIFEASIPWKCFSNEEIPVYTPAVGDVVNFNFAITDISYPCPGTQYVPQMAWTGDVGINTNPSLWGRLLFQ